VAVGLGNQLARGSRSAVYAWGHDAVAKVPFPSTPDSWIHDEAAYTAAVRAAGAPAPEFYGIELVDDRPASIYQRVGGRSMWDHICDRPATTPVHARALAELQAYLFTLVAPVSLPAMRDRLRAKIRLAARRVDPALDAALGAMPPQRAYRICHGDLHPGNVIMGHDGPVLVDWFDVSRGDPTADVARTALLLSAMRHGTASPRHLAGAGPEIVERTRREYLVAVGELVAPDLDELRRWQAVGAVARLAEGVEPDDLLAVWHAWRDTGSAVVLDDRSQVLEHRR
jgi:aminoglycoside phosphotransferase (APT) family kinase protein